MPTIGYSKFTPKTLKTNTTVESHSNTALDNNYCQLITTITQPTKSPCNCTSSSQEETVHIRSCPNYEVIIIYTINKNI